MFKKYLIASFLFIHSQGFADNSNWFKWSLGAFATSQNIFRGAVFYPYATGAFGPSFTFFNIIHLRGPSLALQLGERKDPFQFEIGTRFLDDGAALLSFTDGLNEKKGYWSSRPDGLEVYTKLNYKFGFRNLFGIEAFYAKEVNEHKGYYYSFGVKLPVIKFVSLKFSAGVGSLTHNRYLFGDTAVAGKTNTQTSLTYAMVKVPWDGVLIFDMSYHVVLQEANKSSSLVLGDDKNFNASIRAAIIF